MSDILFAYTTVYFDRFNNSPDANEKEWSGGGGVTDEQLETTVIGNEYSAGGAVLILKDKLSETDSQVAMKVKHYYSPGYMYLNGSKAYISGNTTYIQDLVATEKGQVRLEWKNIDIPLVTLALYKGDRLTEEIYKWDDYIVTSNANDEIWGYRGADRIFGRGGDDVIVGGEGNDYLDGGSGNDTISGGNGTDRIIGGEGLDTALYSYQSRNYVVSRLPGSNEVRIASGAALGEEVVTGVEFISFPDKKINVSDAKFLGWYTSEDLNATFPVQRFYNTRDNAFFYTADFNEAGNVIIRSTPETTTSNDDSWPYVYQGSTFNAASSSISKTTTIHRFYNVETGHHLWSIDPNEIALIKSKWDSGEWSYKYEGTSYRVYSSDPNPSDPNIGEKVYRLYNSEEGRHFYSADVEEVNQFRLTGQWSLEGVAFWGE